MMNFFQKEYRDHLFKGSLFLKLLTVSAGVAFLGLAAAFPASAIEEIPYEVVKKQDNFELRQYSSYLLAETEVNSKFDDAANRAFRDLFRYISGSNQSKKILQEKGENIAMTAPVIQQEKGESNGTYLVSFVVPQKYSLETVPTPKNSKVKIRKVPEKLMASISYSGWWSQDNYLKHKETLYQKIIENGYQIVGQPLYARYNDPFTIWFLRRNEIIVGVEKVLFTQ